MAKTFGQYTGGIEAATGNLVPAYGQMADQTFRTMAGLASTITKTYDTINSQEEENAANKELIKGQQGNLTAIKKLMDANPDTKDSPLSMSINEMIVKLGTAGDLNRGQLKGLLKSSEVFTSQLPLTMQLQDKAFLAQTTAGVNNALKALKGRTVKDDTGYDIPVPSFQGGSPERYEKDLRTFFQQHKADNPKVELDVDKAVRDSIQLQLQGFTNDPDLKKADPAYQQHLIRGFEALGKREAEIPAADTGNEDEVYKAMTEAAAADRVAGQAPADIRRSEIAAQAAEAALAAQRAAGVKTDATTALLPLAAKVDPSIYKTNKERVAAINVMLDKQVADASAKDASLVQETARLKAKIAKEDKGLVDRTVEGALRATSMIPAESAEAKKQAAGVAKDKERLVEIEKERKEIAQEIKDAKYGKSANTVEILDKNDALIEKYRPKTSAEEEILAAKQLTEEGKFKALVGVKSDKYEKRYLEELLADVNKGGYVGFGDRLAQMAIGNERLANEVMNDPEVLRTGGFGTGKIARTATIEGMDIASQRRSDLVDWIRDLRTKQDLGVFEGGSDIRPAQKLAVKKMLADRIAEIDKRIANPIPTKEVTPAEAVAKAAGVMAGTGEEAAKPEAPKPDPYAQGFDYKMTIPGVFKNERPLTYEEEKEGIRQWFEENHNGVVPSTIDAIYKTIRPEAAMIIKTLPTGEKLMYNEGKGWTQLTQMAQAKGMTSEERSDESLYNYGQVVGNRRVPVEARPNSGIMVSGFFGGGKKRAEAFAQNLDDTATLVESVPQVIKMFDKFGHSFQLMNQEEQGIAKSLLVKIRAAIRVETIGTGPIAIAEHKMLMDRLGDPNAWLTLDKHEIAKLQSILDTSKSQLQRTSGGVNVTFRQPSAAGANPVKQNKLDNAIQRGSN